MKGVCIILLLSLSYLATSSATFNRHRNSFSGRRSQALRRNPPHHTYPQRRAQVPSPTFYRRRPVIPILRFNQYGPIDGRYSFDYLTGNGIRRDERGEPRAPNRAVAKDGSWSFTFPDGTPADFSFVADEFGYRPQSSLIPVGPPIPAHAVEQIRRAERERASGIYHDGQWNPRRYG